MLGDLFVAVFFLLPGLLFVVECHCLDYAKAKAEEEVGRTAVADEGECLPSDGEKSDGHADVDDGLKQYECSDTGHTEATKLPFAGCCNADATEVKPCTSSGQEDVL